MTSENYLQILELRKRWKHDRPALIAQAGAHHGVQTEELFLVFEQRSKVVAFEPDPRNFPVLEAKFEGNPMVETVCAAIGDCYRRAPFYPSEKYKGRPWNQSGSIAAPSDRMKDLYPRLSFGDPIEVEVTTLDWHFATDKPDIIFTDIQGGDGLLIAGATLTLAHARLYFCEYYDVPIYENQPSLQQIGELLRKTGNWTLAQKFPWEGDGSAGDALFERRD